MSSRYDNERPRDYGNDRYRDRSDDRSRDRRQSTGELPKVHHTFKGEIVNIQHYGIFVKIPGFEKHGLVHVSQMSHDRVDHPADVVGPNDSIYCKVISVERDKVSLSMKAVSQRTGEDLGKDPVQSESDDERSSSRYGNGRQRDHGNDRYRDQGNDRRRDRSDDAHGSRSRDRRNSSGGSSGMPKLHSIFEGEVVRIQHYGAFVSIPGFQKQGLVHISQMSQNGRVEDPEDVVRANESVFCKVISVENDKIGLSMKVVDQRTGEDLDKNHVQSEMDEQRRRTGPRRDSRPIEFGAVLSTTCKKCGGKGHFAQDCYSSNSGRGYDMVDDDDDSPRRNSRDSYQKKPKKQFPVLMETFQEEALKRENINKKKSKKHAHSSDSDSESHDNNSSFEKKKKAKKHKKIKRPHPSDSSDSDSSYEKKRKIQKYKKSKRPSDSSDTDSDRPPARKYQHSPEPKRYHSPEPKRYQSPEPKRYQSPEPKRYQSPGPRRYQSPEPKRYHSPEPKDKRYNVDQYPRIK